MSDDRTAAQAVAAETARSTTRGPGRPDVTFLTVAEVAAIMRVSKMTVYRLVHDGRLPALQVGRSFRIPESAVSDYLRDAYVQAG